MVKQHGFLCNRNEHYLVIMYINNNAFPTKKNMHWRAFHGAKHPMDPIDYCSFIVEIAWYTQDNIIILATSEVFCS